MLKKKLAALAASLSLLFLTACNDFSSIDGYQLIEQAQVLYEQLESAHVVVTDLDTDIVTQDFTFLYKDDVLTYSYIGTDGATIYYEYHNGSEINHTTADADSWVFIDPSSSDYYTYSKSSRHPYASRQLISVSPESVTSSTVTNLEGGGTQISFEYNVDVLNQNSANSLAEIGTLNSFSVTVKLDNIGNCIELRQQAEVVNDGVTTSENYLLTISDMNAISEITRPVALFEQ